LSDPLTALAGITDAAWLVGGAVRDKLLGRPTADFDVTVDGQPEPVARALARATKGHAFTLSETFGGWRVVSRRHRWQVDLLPLGGESLEADLAKRDFTVNAIAERIATGETVDPHGGLADLQARRLRMVSSRAFEEDPLRTLRLARLVCELGFGTEPETEAAASRAVGGLEQVAPERVFAELKRIVSCERALSGLEMMDAIGASAIVLPELVELQGVEQSSYHHLDVHEHTRAVLAETIALEREPAAVFGEQAAAVSELLSEPLADELSRGQALRFGALLHDIAKPRTRAVTSEGRVTFMGHDEQGANVASDVLGRLRASERLREYVAALTRQHLRLGFLVHQMPLSRHAIYQYLRACDPVQVDVTVLSVADRLATRGRNSEQAIGRHLELARQLLAEALLWRADPPRAPLRGDELAAALGLKPGPELGRLLQELEEAHFAGEISTRAQAVQRARELLAR
jgi:poly(A) polymerase